MMLHTLYKKLLAFAGHKRAPYMLALVSFAESSFFPLPPDPLYIAMIIENRSRTWFLAFLCTISSVIGGFLGYAIGYWLLDTFGAWIIQTYDLQNSFIAFQEGFKKWGFWLIAAKGLTPIPYKVVTIASGVANINLGTFAAASLIARGFRFYLLAVLLWYCGPAVKDYVEKNLSLITIMLFGGLIIGFMVLKCL